jgi:hypothetical protein
MHTVFSQSAVVNRVMASKWVTPVVLAGMFFLLSLALLTSTYFRDTIDFALIIEKSQDARELFNPHHLLYLFTARLNYDLWKSLGYDGSSLLPSQIQSLIVGTAGILVSYSTLKSIVQSARAVIGITLLMAFSYAWWAYSMQGMPYIFTFVLSVLFFSRLLAMTRTPSNRQALLLGLAQGLLVLFHQSTLLLMPVALVSLILSQGEKSTRQTVLWAFVYLLALAFLVGVPYLAVVFGVYKYSALSEIFNYLTRYAQEEGRQAVGVGGVGLNRIPMGALGFGNDIVGEVFLMQLLSKTPLLRPLFLVTLTGWTQSMPPSPPLFILFLFFVGLVLIVAGLAFFFVYWVRNWGRIWDRSRRLVSVALLWFVLMGSFAIYFFPENRQQWIPAIVPFWMIFAIVADDMFQNATWMKSIRSPKLWLTGLVALVLVVNLFGSILPMHDPNNNRNLLIGRWLQTFVTRDDVVLASEAGDLKHSPAYIRYWAECEVLSVRGLFTENQESASYEQILTSKIRATLAQGKHVYVLDDVFDQDLVQSQYAKYSGLTPAQVADRVNRFFATYRLTIISPVEAPISLSQVSLP